MLESYSETETVNLEDIKENTKWKLIFQTPFSKEEISKVSAGCGCTSAKFYPNKRLVAIFEATKIPQHMRHLKSQKFKKKVYLYFKDGRPMKTYYIIGTKHMKK